MVKFIIFLKDRRINIKGLFRIGRKRSVKISTSKPGG